MKYIFFETEIYLANDKKKNNDLILKIRTLQNKNNWCNLT